jgi:uncharacterized protein (TIGR04222 family)
MAILLGVFFRRLLRGPGGNPPPAQALDPYHFAMLRGGVREAANAAIGALVYRGVLSVQAGRGRIHIEMPLAADAHPAEQAIILAFNERRSAPAREIRNRVAEAMRPSLDRLRRLGLAPTSLQSALIRLASAAPMILLIILGLAKIGVGLSRDKPVIYLIALVAISIVLCVFIAGRKVHSTKAGAALLESLREQSGALRAASARPSNMLTPMEVAMAVALYGLPAIAYGSYALGELSTMLRRDREPYSGFVHTSSCGSSASCSSASCGGSSCGGSGCGGGGGCGGCGSS